MAAPINDNFADAIQVDILTPGAVYDSDLVDDSEATFESGEPYATAIGRYYSLWWKYTPAHSGPITITRKSAGMYVLITPYTGSAVNSLTAIYEPVRDAPTYEFDAIGGTTYYIRHSRAYAAPGMAGFSITGETTVPTRVPGTPPLTLIPENDALTVRWPIGVDVDWEIRLDGGAPVLLGQVSEHTFTGLVVGNTYTVEVRGTNTVGSGAWATRTLTLPNMLVWDDFARANSTTSVGTPTAGPAPVSVAGTHGISSQQLYPSALASGQAIILWECGTPNVDIRIKRTAGPLIAGGIFFGATSSTDGWYAFFAGEESSAGSPYLARVRSNVHVVMARGKALSKGYGGVLRLVHHNRKIQMWEDSDLLLEYESDDPVTGTRHGARSTATTFRWDDLTIRESTEITMESDSIHLVPQTRALFSFDFLEVESFLYRGRDTKAQDIAGGS